MSSRFPLPSEPSVRRLGVGNGGGGRPIRAQLVVALVGVLVLIAVPLYLIRRPTAHDPVAAPNASGSATVTASPSMPALSSLPLPQIDPGIAPEERVKAAPAVRVRCGASPGRGSDGSLCDQQRDLEEALTRAVREGTDCAPKAAAKQEGTINYVLTADFSKRTLHVFAGQTGTWRGPQARRSAQCVKRRIAAPRWEALTHQHRYYQIAVLATYKVPSAPKGTPGHPLFD